MPALLRISPAIRKFPTPYPGCDGSAGCVQCRFSARVWQFLYSDDLPKGIKLTMSKVIIPKVHCRRSPPGTFLSWIPSHQGRRQVRDCQSPLELLYSSGRGLKGEARFCAVRAPVYLPAAGSEREGIARYSRADTGSAISARGSLGRRFPAIASEVRANGLLQSIGGLDREVQTKIRPDIVSRRVKDTLPFSSSERVRYGFGPGSS